MYKVIITADKEHELKVYEYEYDTLHEAEGHYNVEIFNALLIETADGKETIIKSK